MKTRTLLLLLMGLGLAAGGLVLLACSTGGGGSRMVSLDSKGRATVTVQTYDSLLVGLEGAEPLEHYDFVATPSGEAPVLGQARLYSNMEGDIEPALLLIDLDPVQVPPGSYDVAVTGPSVDLVETVEVEVPTEPYIYTCDANGHIKNSYLLGEPAYAAGGNFPPNTEVHLAGIADRSVYDDGDPLDPPLGDNGGGTVREPAVVAMTDADGKLAITQVLAYAWFDTEGTGFDMVADLEPFGEYNEGLDAVDGHAVVGATYQTVNVGADVDAELACDMFGLYKDTFGLNENIHLWINPPLQYVTPQKWVDKYIVDHKDEWKDGDILTDVSGGSEMDGVQTGCTNEYVVMVSGPLPAGAYDAIIDVDQDGKYTQGLDIVDGGCADAPGQIGFKVE